mgnify:CR=1 FL=1
MIAFDINGKLIRERRKREDSPQFEIGEPVKIIGLEPGMEYLGEVVKLRPLRAKVIQPDPIWHGLEVGRKSIKKAIA